MSITSSNVSKSFGSECAVDALDLAIESGEFFAVLGPSGCGKSTLLRLIAGLEQLDMGEIKLGEEAVAGPNWHMPPEARQVGVVFQSYALWPHMSVEGNVAFPLETAGRSRKVARQEARSHLKTVELTEYANRKPAQLSGGQRQRVALARCLAQGARTILMDEPLANLDPHLRASMEEELSDFHRATGATVLYITHDQREAMALANRLAVMWDGKLLQVGEPDDIYRRPINERVASFIGRGAILPAHVTNVSGGEAHVKVGSHEITSRCQEGTRPGSVRVLIRPNDTVVSGDGDAICATVEQSTYRGGTWEAVVSLPRFPETLNVLLAERVAVGDVLPLHIRGGWVLPTSAAISRAKE